VPFTRPKRIEAQGRHRIIDHHAPECRAPMQHRVHRTLRRLDASRPKGWEAAPGTPIVIAAAADEQSMDSTDTTSCTTA